MTKTEQLAQMCDSIDNLLLAISGVNAGEVAVHLRKQGAVLEMARQALQALLIQQDGEYHGAQKAIAAIQEILK